MECFLETIRCVLCCTEDDHEYRDHEALERDDSTTTIVRAPPPPCIRQGFSEDARIKSAIEKDNYQNSVLRGFSSPARNYSVLKPPGVTPKPILLPQPPSTSYVPQKNSVDASINSKSSASIKPESVNRSLAKSQENLEKLKNSAPSPSIPSINQRNSSDTGIYKQNDYRHNQNPSPATPVVSKNLSNAEVKKPEVPKIANSSVLHRNAKDPLPYPFSSEPPPSPFKPLPLSTLPPSLSDSDPPNSPNKTEYVWVQKDTTPLYTIPENVEELIKKDIVPEVLKKPLTQSTYRDYFAALLYAEDYYIEKWSKFCMHNVTLELHEAAIYTKSSKNRKLSKNDERDERIFVAFKIDSIPERRPFLLSRDYVLLKPSGKMVEPFQGIFYRVVKSTFVLAEFEDDFHSQHRPNCKYDVSFSFNRVCLKRAHQAVEKVAKDPLLLSFLFPSHTSRISFLAPPSVIPSHHNLEKKQAYAIYYISRLKGPPPYLIEGPLSVEKQSGKDQVKKLSTTGLVIKEAIFEIFRTSPDCRILINAPTNNTCDVLWRNLKEKIPNSNMFRANAAFRELDGVPCDIRRSCPFKGECFTCPSVQELKSYKVVLSTFVSSFRLYNEGIGSGHFSHIFLVDASSATEPELMVSPANLANEKTIIVVTGAIGDCSGWVRSDIARRSGLRKSFFQRLFESKPYQSQDPMFVTCINDEARIG